MFPSQHQSPTTTCSFMPQLTLASMNARQSESPTIKSWTPDYAFDFGIPSFQPREFQSNSTFDSHSLFERTPPTRAGLGIQYPNDPAEIKPLFSPIHTMSEIADGSLPVSPRLVGSYSGGPTFYDAEGNLHRSLHSSWSLSMLYADVHREETSARTSDRSTDASARESSISEDLSLESLSAAAGLSIEEFTDKITEGAKYALKKVADYEFSGGTSMPPGVGPGPDAPPFSDISALDLADAWFPCFGVNPADVMPAPPLMSTGTSVDDMFNVLGSGLNLNEAVLDLRPPELQYPTTPPAQIAALTHVQGPQARSTAHLREDGDQLSDYEPPAFLSPSSSEYSPSLGSGRPYHTRASKVKKRKIQLCDTVDPKNLPVPGPLLDSASLPPIDLGSPVFDAHRGIDLEDLKARAERYRLRNQGREYDKRWLLSYAGKLSRKGELLEEFRCYITGCQQVNKRRDHILIHVGAHLDQRPFKCVHCSARFLRKNECKRHELSHTGIRPFTCHMCPFPATTFVRQDLLRRHMKRTHQIDEDKENKGSTSRPMKKAKKF